MKVDVREVVDARKTKIGPKDVPTLLDRVDKVYAARGQKVVTFDLQSNRPDDAELLAHLIGRTGTLRAPAAVIGRTLVVGFITLRATRAIMSCLNGESLCRWKQHAS